MEPPTNPIQPPVTPSHASLLSALSPAVSEQQTPAPLHTLPLHLRQPMPQPHIAPPVRPGSAQPQDGLGHQQSQGIRQGMDENVFGSVMGSAPGTAGPDGLMGGSQPKVYASVYSGIPVFEAMIRGISVMRRTSDSWVNATQVLKVAGVNKSARTKVLEKEVLGGIHEKIQGGYGKYQGTWVPLDRGRELAEQYGVANYLAPIFEFQPSASAVAALPVIRTGTPDRSNRKTPANSIAAGQRLISPLTSQLTPPVSVPQYQHNAGPGAEHLMGLPPHPSSLAYPSQPKPYYTMPPPPMSHHGPYDDQRDSMNMTPTMSSDNGLAPAADITRMGMPYNPSDIYIDQYGQPHATYQATAYPKEEPSSKRQRSDVQGGFVDGGAAVDSAPAQAEEDVDDADSSASDDARDAPPLPSSMLLPHKPVRPKATTANGRNKFKLVQIFNIEGAVNLQSVFGLGPDQSANFDIDMVIDDQGHSALHWACALAKMDIVKQLIELGADIHRGNYAGETPLIRSVLTSNHAESGTFPQVLQYLSPSIRTLDHAYRTVLHHIALIAGVKGRTNSARAYLANVLEWVAREQQQSNSHSIISLADSSSSTPSLAPISLKTLVDVQDVHGDTALNVAARVGNRGLVNLLLDAGADKTRANKLGLRPENFGLEIEGLKVGNGDAVVASLKSEVSKPERKSRDVQKNIASIFEDISTTFTSEMLAKQTKLNATEASVRHATRALADKRQHLHRAQDKLDLMHLFEQRADNVKRILGAAHAGMILSPEEFTGRSQTGQEKTTGQLPPLAFRHIPGPPLNPLSPSGQGSGAEGEDYPLPERDDGEGLVKLRRIALWEDRASQHLEDRVNAMEGEGMERAMKYRKLVSMCSKVPVDKVDGMLDGLVAAVESEGQTIDFSKVSKFVHRVKDTRA